MAHPDFELTTGASDAHDDAHDRHEAGEPQHRSRGEGAPPRGPAAGLAVEPDREADQPDGGRPGAPMRSTRLRRELQQR
jgi:hypothetical protein